MISSSMAAALNKHMNFELHSANIYLSMSSCANEMGFKGAATWFMVQYQEEMVHFMKFYNYLVDQGVNISILASTAVPNTYSSLLDMFTKTLAHEQTITGCINDLTEQAVQERDHATQIFLQWFVTEQIEEENNDRDILAKLKIVGTDGHGLLMIDSELGQRVFVPPAGGAAPFPVA
ncbi:ferritin [Trichlorobacter ammonificans]|uniref:Ferritin n=1 Tax=Trichlorobacter ammonificans TaxID=2916410 RepID=A0ABM9D6B2_9BACT|nr:ferritin [Trichlorobacter ammonificans]CAH2030783.1 putative bacterial non-heme ferritin-like protein [Trichlorobacter ammonificans]